MIEQRERQQIVPADWTACSEVRAAGVLQRLLSEIVDWAIRETGAVRTRNAFGCAGVG